MSLTAVISPEQDLSGFAEIAGTKTMICSLNKLVHLEKKIGLIRKCILMSLTWEKWTELFLSMHQKYVPLHFEMQFNNVYTFMKEQKLIFDLLI